MIIISIGKYFSATQTASRVEPGKLLHFTVESTEKPYLMNHLKGSTLSEVT